MNALELADKLDDSLKFLDAMNTQYKNGFGKYRLLPKEVATMLRQQHTEIEALKTKVDYSQKFAFDMNIRALKAEKKQLSMISDGNGNIGIGGDFQVEPQYRELSDTEIVRISETCDLNHVLGLIDFARAILKKASEK